MKYKNIEADNVFIGQNTIIEESAIIRGVNGNAKTINIGDNCYIGKNVQIICDDFSLGDYSKLHHNTNVHGYLPCKIGHNAWIGQYSIIDSIGGTTIGNNCGIGAHSQIWSHVKFGDTLEGCRFLSEKEMIIGNDVWFVGHCIVSPITAQDKSMALVGSVVTKNMNYNEIYAGSPAKSLSDKIGYQFKEVSIDEKFGKMTKYLNSWNKYSESIKIVESLSDIDFNNSDISFFNVSNRTYTKRGSNEEVEFMKFLLPEKAKFTPIILE
ncbi:DapH/DapD/GlmU-related protein [uncultured Algibacter sp.]|uniref:acyltransferase n=1 Tax=uncultured Algibacter sp. TaxID=298659 RepID=UPI0032166164